VVLPTVIQKIKGSNLDSKASRDRFSWLSSVPIEKSRFKTSTYAFYHSTQYGLRYWESLHVHNCFVSCLWFQFVAADSNTDQAKTGLQDIASQIQTWVQSFRDRAERAISEALATAQNFIQSLQDRFKDSQDKLTSAYSNYTSSASEVKACVQSGQQKADAVANSTSTHSIIIIMFLLLTPSTRSDSRPGVILRLWVGAVWKLSDLSWTPQDFEPRITVLTRAK
jgi:vacuolar-type H+-ATPase subunit H